MPLRATGRRTRAAVAAALFTSTLLLGACDHDEEVLGGPEVPPPTFDPPAPTFDPPPPTFDPPPPTYDPPSQPVLVPPATSCPDTHNEPVDIVATSSGAATQLQGITVCNGSLLGELWMKNGSLLPWSIVSPVFSQPAPTEDGMVMLFREVLALTPNPPAGVQIEPGQEWTFPGLPEQLRLELHPGASSAWQVLDAGKSALEGKGLSDFASEVSRKGRTRQALAQCGLMAYEGGQLAGKVDRAPAQTPGLFVIDSLGLVEQTTACGQALDARRQPATGDRLALTADDLLTEVQKPTWLSTTDDALRSAGKVLLQAR